MHQTVTAPPAANVASRLTAMARGMPDAVAVAAPRGRDTSGRRQYESLTFAQLDADSDRVACGLRRMGVAPGARLALLVRPGIDFVSLVFALLKSGAVPILIDPGMGRKNLVGCLEQTAPAGFVAVPVAHAVRSVLRRRFPGARLNVTVGRRWAWGGPTLEELRRTPVDEQPTVDLSADDPAAVIFTTGSTGPPKGVLYTHGNFNGQVDAIRDFYDIQPGEIDLAAFPLFGLFNCAMGVTTVIPDMDPSRPAKVDPARLVEAIHDWNVTQSFGSPAIWNRVGHYCVNRNIGLTSLRRVLSAGAPVPLRVLAMMKACIHPEGEVHTPYGATESLPVASISASEVFRETAQRSAAGAGTCVGRRFPGTQWKVIRAVEGPIARVEEIEELPRGEIGELIVRGAVVTGEYVTRVENNPLAKIADGDSVWHRIGDVGYFDERQRFWFCGRKAHRVRTADGPMYTIPCEAIFNNHPAVFRSALVGVGPPGGQRPVLIVEPWPDQFPRGRAAREVLVNELAEIGADHELTRSIRNFLIRRSLPVDIRHNAKIFREALARWAARKKTLRPRG
jgi:acyl-CoA synthetase (AMP-forming)/AMP-acid ligase II